jgi:uncharacterized membrane protein
MKHLAQIARIGVGVAVACSGLMQGVNAEFVRLVPALPAWVPAPPVLAIASGAALMLIGGALIANWRTRGAALALTVLLTMVLLARMPEILGNPGAGFVWTNPAKILAMIGGALVLANPGRGWLRLAAGLLAAFLILAGVQHFVYAGFVDTLVPAWIPPGQRFWTYFSAIALLAGGLGLIWPPTTRLAGLLSGLMVFLWMLLLHIPRSVGMRSAFELAGVLEALAIAGIAWLVAAGHATSLADRK